MPCFAVSACPVHWAFLLLVGFLLFLLVVTLVLLVGIFTLCLLLVQVVFTLQLQLLAAVALGNESW